MAAKKKTKEQDKNLKGKHAENVVQNYRSQNKLEKYRVPQQVVKPSKGIRCDGGDVVVVEIKLFQAA